MSKAYNHKGKGLRIEFGTPPIQGEMRGYMLL